MDQILGQGFTLIVQTESLIETFSDIKYELWPELDCQIVAVGKTLIDKPDGIIRLKPIPDATTKRLYAHRDQIILVRPDRYVAASFDQYNYKKAISIFRDFLV